jgi:hypothetical protein
MHVGPDAGTPSTLAARWPRSPAGWRCGWSERPCWWPAAPTVAAARTRPARGASGVSIFEPARPTPRGLPWWSSPRASSRTSTKAGSTTWWGAAALWSSRTCHTGASGCGSGARVGGRAAGGPVGTAPARPRATAARRRGAGRPLHRRGDGGKPRFDLDRFDGAFLERLRDRVVGAGGRGIYAVMFFDGRLPVGTGGVQPRPPHPRDPERSPGRKRAARAASTLGCERPKQRGWCVKEPSRMAYGGMHAVFAGSCCNLLNLHQDWRGRRHAAHPPTRDRHGSAATTAPAGSRGWT